MMRIRNEAFSLQKSGEGKGPTCFRVAGGKGNIYMPGHRFTMGGRKRFEVVNKEGVSGWKAEQNKEKEISLLQQRDRRRAIIHGENFRLDDDPAQGRGEKMPGR